MCDSSTRVIAVLEYLVTAFHYQGRVTISLVCHYFIVLDSDRTIITGCDRLLRDVTPVLDHY